MDFADITVDSVKSLHLLASVHQLGSVSAAAAACGISQPSATARLARLERDLSVPLLRRSPSGSELTSQGLEVLTSSMPVLHAVNEFESVVRTLREADNLRLRVVASLTVATHLLPTWIAEADLDAMGTNIEIRADNSQNVCRDVVSEDSDLGFIEAPSVPSTLDSVVVAHDELVLIVAPDHPWGDIRSVSSSDVCQTRLVLREQGSGARDYAETRLKAATGVQLPEAAAELDTNEGIIQEVVSSLRVGMVSRLAVEHELAAGRLIRIVLSDVDLSRDIRAVVSRGKVPTGAVLELLATARRLGLHGQGRDAQ